MYKPFLKKISETFFHTFDKCIGLKISQYLHLFCTKQIQGLSAKPSNSEMRQNSNIRQKKFKVILNKAVQFLFFF